MTSDLHNLLEKIKTLAIAQKCKIATAESCTGGMIASLLTELPGSSDFFDCGFITYSNQAKTDMLSVAAELIAAKGAVSADVAIKMAEGALLHSSANLAVSVTGIAGPTGATETKPIGRVYLALAKTNQTIQQRQFDFGTIGRDAVRSAATR
ncbi:MAG: CinA family protein, partial [Pseudomonadota bacterium]